MEVVFGFVLLVLACAVVLLFAMFGELASRVGDGGGGSGGDGGDRGDGGGPRAWSGLRPLEGARIGAEPRWPSELDGVPGAERAVVLALSTSCGSCQDVAQQLAGGREAAGFTIALACRSQEDGIGFIKEHGLGSVPHFLDETGTWLRGELGVQSSPVGLVFHKGRLASADVFGDIKSIKSLALVNGERRLTDVQSGR
ncbi:MAG TPA: hypothetical protein VF062_00500 [Candidatus Limnocylindrales bacterium]